MHTADTHRCNIEIWAVPRSLGATRASGLSSNLGTELSPTNNHTPGAQRGCQPAAPRIARSAGSVGPTGRPGEVGQRSDSPRFSVNVLGDHSAALMNRARKCPDEQRAITLPTTHVARSGNPLMR